MDLKGIFTPNTIAMPQWKNKAGENEFEKLLNQLADMGKKLKSVTKVADIPVQMPTEDPGVVSVEHYDATPRPLGEIFNSRGQMSEQAIAKARDIVGKQLATLNLPSSDVHYIKSDISRFGGDGTPATGRISFQIPFLTAQGDQRTIYADVDIILGSLIPPRHFSDSMNHRYAFTEDGMKELLEGREFDVMQNTKIQPETVYFESPGHLAGRGGMMITKYAEEEKKPEKTIPGEELADLLSKLETLDIDIPAIQKEIGIEQQKLDTLVQGLPQAGELARRNDLLKAKYLAKKETLSQIEKMLGQIKEGLVENKGRIYKLQTKKELSKTPLYTRIIGKLVAMFPHIKGLLDTLWRSVRSTTNTYMLRRESPTEAPKEWEIRREAPVEPAEFPKYDPESEEKEKLRLDQDEKNRKKKETSEERKRILEEEREQKRLEREEKKKNLPEDTVGAQGGMMTKQAEIMDDMEALVEVLMEMDAVLSEAGV